MEPSKPLTHDPFDLASLRLPQNFEDTSGVKRIVTTVPVRKPDRTWFVRVRPGEEWRLSTGIVELKDERETYLVAPSLRHELASEMTPKVLFTAINRQGVLFLWIVKLPNVDGRSDTWSQSALAAATQAEGGWVRVIPNNTLGGYDLYTARAGLPDPEWPDLSFQEIIRLAFKDRMIDSLDHPVVRRLKGFF